MAHQGWDTLTIDLQHGVIDYQAMVGMLQAISTTATVPIVRVPWLEAGAIMKALKTSYPNMYDGKKAAGIVDAAIA